MDRRWCHRCKNPEANEAEDQIRSVSLEISRSLAMWQAELNEFGNDTSRKLKSSHSSSIAAIQASLEQAREGIADRVPNLYRNWTIEQVGVTFRILSWEYISRLLSVLCLLVITGYLNSLSSVIAGYRTPNVKIISAQGHQTNETTLPDIGHDLVTFFMTMIFGDGTTYLDMYELPNHFINICIPMTIIFIILHPRRFVILRRSLIVFSFLNLLRSFTVVMTSLPDASPICQEQFNNITGTGAYKLRTMFPKVFQRAFVIFTKPSEHVTCGDMIFSGHTTLLVLCNNVFLEYGRPCQFDFFPPLLLTTLRWVSTLLTYIGVICIVSTRLHYTLDVALAIYLTTTCFKGYHNAVTGDNLMHSHTWFSNAYLRWLEAEEVLSIDQDAYENYKHKNSLQETRRYSAIRPDHRRRLSSLRSGSRSSSFSESEGPRSSFSGLPIRSSFLGVPRSGFGGPKFD